MASLLCCAASLPARAAEPLLPALVDPPSQEHHVGKAIFAELVTPDLAGAERFYGGLFGWTFRDIPVGSAHYAEAMQDGQQVAGLIQRDIPPGEQRHSAWLTFLAVRDVDAAKTVAVQHGAKVLFEPHDIPGLGREAVLADPQGAVFAVLASSSGDPPDVLADPGQWIWSSLVTSDPDSDAAFYQAVFGYDVFDMPTAADAQHFVFATENYARASANPLPQGAHPAWLDFVRVEDAGNAAEQAAALGGRVLVPPFTDRHGGRIAVVADPTGAAFGVMEWPESLGAGGVK
jgi:predicted enzyme related to lactoylglutathione lyase